MDSGIGPLVANDYPAMSVVVLSRAMPGRVAMSRSMAADLVLPF
jgi:hypothetical protein